jgi:DNA-binding transcriptional ArsR family regulator
LSYILKEIFGDTKRVRILEELIEHAGEFLSVSEISKMSDVSKKTVYSHLYQLEEMRIITSHPGRITKYGLNMDDSRAVALSIIADEEYLRKMEISIKST